MYMYTSVSLIENYICYSPPNWLKGWSVWFTAGGLSLLETLFPCHATIFIKALSILAKENGYIKIPRLFFKILGNPFTKAGSTFVAKFA